MALLRSGAWIAREVVAAPAAVGGPEPHLVFGHGELAAAEVVPATGDELSTWIGATLVKWFSPDHDLGYTYARLRRLSRSADTDALTEADLEVLALLGEMLS